MTRPLRINEAGGWYHVFNRGQDLVFWAVRRYSGRTLKELGDFAGGVDYTAVANAIKRVDARAKSDKTLRRAMEHIRRKCEA